MVQSVANSSKWHCAAHASTKPSTDSGTVCFNCDSTAIVDYRDYDHSSFVKKCTAKSASPTFQKAVV